MKAELTMPAAAYPKTTYHKAAVDGLEISYREAGSPEKPTVLLLHDYQNNVPRYAAWQTYLRQHQPPTLITWGRNDPFFTEAGARAYLKDLPKAELHLFDTGHFALEEDGPLIATLIRNFLHNHH